MVKKLDSLQKMMIEKVKYQVKKDLDYVSLNTKTGKSMRLPQQYGYKYMMTNPMTKYGHSFEYHVKSWLDVHTIVGNNQFIYTEYGLAPDSILPDDVPVIRESIYKWMAKMKKECYM